MLLDNFADDTGANRTATFADCEAKLFIHGDRGDQLYGNSNVVTRHNHLGSFRELNDTSHIRGAEVKLRTIALEERCVTAALFLGQDVGFCLELGMRSDAARFART